MFNGLGIPVLCCLYTSINLLISIGLFKANYRRISITLANTLNANVPEERNFESFFCGIDFNK